MARLTVNRNGLSLTELLITATIIGVIMIGIMSADYAIRSAEQNISRGASVSLRINAMMAHILRSAEMAVGDERSLNKPIEFAVYDDATGIADMPADNTNYICMQHDADPANDDFEDYTYVCYTRRGTNLHKCTNVASPQACAAGEIIGQVVATTFTGANAPRYVKDNTDASATFQNIYFQVTLVSRFDPAQAADPIDNPEVTLTSQVSPLSANFYEL